VGGRSGVVLSLAVVGLGLIGGWRWWAAPWREAQREARAPELVELRGELSARLFGFGVEARFDEGRVDANELRWRAPGGCVEVYRVRVDERYRDPGVAIFLGRAEDHASWVLALGEEPGRGVRGVLTAGTGASPPTEARVRELWWGALEVGPRAPDWTCRRQTWDPLEDALALGWPRLPGAGLWVGQRWQGAAVEGRCHETVCVSPEGQFGTGLPCRARAWREQLAGVDGGLALIRGDWDDGHDPAQSEIGILTSRVLVIDEGRPLYVRAVIDQRWVGVRRELTLERIDDCGGRSLAIDADAGAVADTRARFHDEFRAKVSRPAAGD